MQYYHMLLRSYEEMEKLEAWDDFIRNINLMEKALTDEWKKGIGGSDQNRKAVMILSNIPKIGSLVRERIKLLEQTMDANERSSKWRERVP